MDERLRRMGMDMNGDDVSATGYFSNTLLTYEDF
jgi:hypothetical protein